MRVDDPKKLLLDMGYRILSKRKLLNLTQEELAEKANVTKQVISNAENGKTALRPENIIKICSVLEISTDYLLRGNISEVDIAYMQKKVRLR